MDNIKKLVLEKAKELGAACVMEKPPYKEARVFMMLEHDSYPIDPLTGSPIVYCTGYPQFFW